MAFLLLPFLRFTHPNSMPAKKQPSEPAKKTAAKKAAKKAPAKKAATATPAKKTATKKAAPKKSAKAQLGSPATYEALQTAAFLQFCHRAQNGILGDEMSDWLHAEASLSA